jgi:hypothetical protein
MKKNIFLILLLTAQVIFISCKDNPVETKINTELQPGRRDYVWDEVTLEIPQGEYCYINSMWGNSPTNIWAVGIATSCQNGIWHYDGHVWRSGSNVPICAQSAVWGTDSTNIWLANSGGILWHYNGNGWTNTTQLQVKRYEDFGVQQFYGISANEIYAIGTAYASYFNEEQLGGIFKYDGESWKQIDMPILHLNFFQARKASNGNFIMAAVKGSVDSTMIITWNGKEAKELISAVGFSDINVFNIGDKTLFNFGKKIYIYENGTYSVWKDFSGTDYYGKVLCSRSEKDFFVGSFDLKGVYHYNGSDLELIYSAPNTRVLAGLIFEKDVFITMVDQATNKTRILHGRLKE